MKTGVLGGSFDPIHIGHLILANEIREAAGLDNVLFVPAYSPPHKTASDTAPGEHRLQMVALAVADNPSFEASDIELRRGGVSYTVETIAELKRERPDDELYFIIGADTVPELVPQVVCQLCRQHCLANASHPVEPDNADRLPAQQPLAQVA